MLRTSFSCSDNIIFVQVPFPYRLAMVAQVCTCGFCGSGNT